jgi:phospholipase/lecithinase/hemolysin
MQPTIDFRTQNQFDRSGLEPSHFTLPKILEDLVKSLDDRVKPLAHPVKLLDHGPIAIKLPIVQAAPLPTPIDLGRDLGQWIPASFSQSALFGQFNQVLTTAYNTAYSAAYNAYNSLVAQYSPVLQDLNQFVQNLPNLNFANPLTINSGNTLRDRQFNQLVIFGDSLTDTGNLAKLLGGLFPPNPPYFNGRLSNGPLWVEYLAPELGLNPSQIKNFAVAGATSGRSNVAALVAAGQNLSQNVIQQLNQLPGMLNQIDLFANQLASGTTNGTAGRPATANPKALYVVWAGANDFLTLPQDPVAAIQSVLASVGNVTKAVSTLAKLGAKTIVVPNLPNLGVTPFAAARNLIPQATAFSTAFNTLLQGELGGLETNLGIDIVQIDIFSLSQAIATRPSEFGFTNITTPLFQAALSAKTPINPNNFAFADDFHPTTAVHRLISNTVKRSLTQPTPSQVFATSGQVVQQVVQQLVNSSGFQSTIGKLFSDFTKNPLTPNPLLANASSLWP